MIKKITYALSIIVMAVTVGSCQSSGNYKTVDEKAFSSLSLQKDVIVLDVRTPEEFKEGHLPNAQLLDYYGDNFEKGVEKLDKTKTYLVYCKSGGRSASASEIMAKKGLKVVNLDGGISSWNGKVVK